MGHGCSSTQNASSCGGCIETARCSLAPDLLVGRQNGTARKSWCRCCCIRTTPTFICSEEATTARSSSGAGDRPPSRPSRRAVPPASAVNRCPHPERNRKYCCDVTREPEVLPSDWNWKCYRIVCVRTGRVIVTSHGNRKHCRQTETGSAYVSCGRRAALPRIGWG